MLNTTCCITLGGQREIKKHFEPNKLENWHPYNVWYQKMQNVSMQKKLGRPLSKIHDGNVISLQFMFFAALILEEIAIDSHNKAKEERLLNEAQELHLASLALAKKAFGENNVQTAKHYGNLGRLYQSMHRFEVRWFTLMWLV